ncbi:hypothetical protein B0H17DRAFT_1135050 [Mycena rosella]|uniref:Uncharacterized protein n=1 Tax=Mycena rosella TaxID=1033263 RepID=A0AAD7DER8_MYCRO|nr:hypothetical protein B0H17DRAFT_1135050 [Mycena rosella]
MCSRVIYEVEKRELSSIHFPLFTLVFEVGLQDSVGNGVIGNVLFSDPAMPFTIGIGMAEKWVNKRKEIVGIMGVIECRDNLARNWVKQHTSRRESRRKSST